MVGLSTERLLLIPLPAELLRLGLEDPDGLAAHLDLEVMPQEVDEGLRQAHLEMLRLVEEHPEEHEWYTEWRIVARRERCAVGGFCFKGPPDAAGAVEVGYGLYPPFQGRGYMTEALRAAIRWAFRHPQAEYVTAEVEVDNLASIAVLRRLGMTCYRETDAFQYWRVACHHLD